MTGEPTYPTITFVILVHSGLAHGRCVDREPCLLKELLHLVADVITEDTGVNEDNDVSFRFFDKLFDLIDDKVFGTGVIETDDTLQGDVKAFGRHLSDDKVGREGEIHRAILRQPIKVSPPSAKQQERRAYLGHTLNNRLVNHPRRRLDIIQPRSMHGNLLRYLRIGAVPPISQSMVQERTLLLLSCARHAGDMQYWNHLGEGARDTIGGRELSYTKGRGYNAECVGLDSRVAVGGVGGVEFVAVSDPVDVGVVFDEVL